eukprot:1443449-Prymnesium_polylepis.1
MPSPSRRPRRRSAPTARPPAARVACWASSARKRPRPSPTAAVTRRRYSMATTPLAVRAR